MPRKSSDSMDQTIMPAKSSAIIPPIDCHDKHRAPFVAHPNPNAIDPVPSGTAHTIHCNRLHQAPLNMSPVCRDHSFGTRNVSKIIPRDNLLLRLKAIFRKRLQYCLVFGSISSSGIIRSTLSVHSQSGYSESGFS
uniref:Uncharacterized protein n=1 Tax=Glossina pallidipes TaxID=7398 RepID=A0A1A9ZRE7_GLOPL